MRQLIAWERTAMTASQDESFVDLGSRIAQCLKGSQLAEVAMQMLDGAPAQAGGR